MTIGDHTSREVATTSTHKRQRQRQRQCRGALPGFGGIFAGWRAGGRSADATGGIGAATEVVVTSGSGAAGTGAAGTGAAGAAAAGGGAAATARGATRSCPRVTKAAPAINATTPI